jgi:glutathione synthase/RimK-type ligase-like ATP-grasp enzyme
VLFQQFVDGANCRVHDINGHVMGMMVEAETVDYRFADHIAWETFSPPREMRELVSSCAREMGLLLSGTDFRQQASSRKWFALEVNRAPAFAFFDHLVGNPIAKTLVRICTAANRNSRAATPQANP